jgi:hypothetical protein
MVPEKFLSVKFTVWVIHLSCDFTVLQMMQDLKVFLLHTLVGGAVHCDIFIHAWLGSAPPPFSLTPSPFLKQLQQVSLLYFHVSTKYINSIHLSDEWLLIVPWKHLAFMLRNFGFYLGFYFCSRSPCLGLAHSPWPSFMGYGFNDNLILRV